MNTTTADDLIVLLVQRVANVASSASIVDWATNALVAGEETPSLVVLAGLDRGSSVFETTPWLDRALVELNVHPLAPADLRRAYVGVVSRAFLDGRITLQEALDNIHQDAVSPLGHPPDLASWCYVWEGLNPRDFSPLTGANLDAEARKLAAEWARHTGLSASAQRSVKGGA